ncbi:alpha/beta fold hydrolase [Sphingosinithalassobacter sp. LHW66-3]|uniref:alpha/beta fold hydrolase n=1 Tax=Sphingosinithalassobacter sp. LHW66-3 TaxID=3424718 RepID=UPI003D6BD30A
MSRTGKMLTGLGAAGLLGGGLALWSSLSARGAEAAVPPDGEFLEVQGARIHYVDRGEGPPVVMIHGLLGQMRNFNYGVADALAQDHRVLLVDRPGWGHSQLTQAERPGIAEQATMLADFLRARRVGPALIVGHSLGGAVALALALDHPDLVRGLALIAPLTQPMPAPPPQFVALMAPPLIRTLVAWTLAVPGGQINGPAAARAVFAPDAVPEDFQTRGGGALSIRPSSYEAGSFEVTHAAAEMAALAERYGALRLPVGILFGRDDAVLAPEDHGAKAAQAIAGADLKLVAGGHMLPVTWPEVTEQWIRDRAAIG